MKKIDTDTKRNTIIAVALSCLKDSSSKDLSIRQICTKGNISIGTIYHYFKSKEDLLTAIMLKYDDTLTSQTINFLTHESEAENLLIFADSFALDSVNNTNVSGTIVSSIDLPLPSTEEERVAERCRPLYQIPCEIIQRGQDKGEFSKKYDAPSLTDKYIMILRGASIEWFRRKYTYNIRQYTREVTELFIDAISNKQ